MLQRVEALTLLRKARRGDNGRGTLVGSSAPWRTATATIAIIIAIA